MTDDKYRVETITHIQGAELTFPQHWIYEGFNRAMQVNSHSCAVYYAHLLNETTPQQRYRALKAALRKGAA